MWKNGEIGLTTMIKLPHVLAIKGVKPVGNVSAGAAQSSGWMTVKTCCC